MCLITSTMSVDEPTTEAHPGAGYEKWPIRGTFVPGFATLWVCELGDARQFRVQVGQAHLNGSGHVHGGFIATMADLFLGHNVARKIPEETKIVTSSLTVDYLGSAKPGDWLDSNIDRIRCGRRVCFASGAITCGGELVATMRASFQVLN